MAFFKEHLWWGAVLAFLIFTLPQWVNALWGLFSPEPMAVVLQRRATALNLPTFSPYWITIPLGLLMLVLVLYNRRTKRKFTFDYAYGLALAGIHLGYDDSMNPPPIQLGLVLANATEYPIKYDVEQFEVVIENRAIGHPEFQTRSGVISSRMTATYFYPSFGKELPEGRDHLNGVIRFTILYGHPEVGFFRKMKKELTVSLRLGDKMGIVWLVEKESDESIRK